LVGGMSAGQVQDFVEKVGAVKAARVDRLFRR